MYINKEKIWVDQKYNTNVTLVFYVISYKIKDERPSLTSVTHHRRKFVFTVHFSRLGMTWWLIKYKYNNVKKGQ